MYITPKLNKSAFVHASHGINIRHIPAGQPQQYEHSPNLKIITFAVASAVVLNCMYFILIRAV